MQPRSLRVDGSEIHFAGRSVQSAALADALQVYLSSGQTRQTADIELQASALAAQGFADEGAVAEFIRTVCAWGGYAGISGRVLKRNQAEVIRARLLAAKAAIEQQEPELQTAIREVRALDGLGLSFASKHLRMLWPRHCPVLDSVLHEKLGYPMNSTGYWQLATDCRAVAVLLEREGISNPARDNRPQWYVADVEASIFQLVRA